ncbi:MAG TPA: pilus assembly protein TadG-related protein [Solirubrobacteraceae bacterium]|nr:pilus assembly protein TadG-related protein [Solirubrobacteraceae bacterium]
MAVLVGGALVALLGLTWFVIDVGNAFEHRRHLQMQADAGALAGAGDFRFPCSDAPILEQVAKYSGDELNAQVNGGQSRVQRKINSPLWHNQSSPQDPTVREGGPCEAGMIDVKLTETDLPFLLKIADLIPGFPGDKFDFINSHARVEFRQLDRTGGTLPVGVEDVRPKAIRAEFVDETTGAVIGTRDLTQSGMSGGLTLWSNAAQPLPVNIPSTSHIGVRIVTSGSGLTTCGAPLVECYDTATANGLVHIRGWSGEGSGAQPNPPRARSVRLVSGSCEDPYFVVVSATCTVGVRATVDFGNLPPADARVQATVGKNVYPLAYDATSATWQSPAGSFIPVPAAAGPVDIGLSWEETSGTVNGQTCTTRNNNPCKGTFAGGGMVQRVFSGTPSRSGPIRLLRVSENGVPGANSFRRCEAGNLNCTHDLVVTAGLVGSLANAQSVDDPIVALRVVGGSQNQSLDCDPAQPKLRDELAFGCAPEYARNTGTLCPATATALWATAQPWNCVAIQTGSATNQVPAGMNLRILGSEKPASCTSPNQWSKFPNIPSDDPRFVEVFLVPFNSFSGSGSGTRPVVEFATFYVTGWTGKGSGFNNPCQGNGDDPVPGDEAGYIVGHFVKYVQTLNEGGAGEERCDEAAFGTCVAVMTQ